MGVWDSVRAELEEQRCLIEQQQITIQRQQRKIELQFALTSHLQAELDRIQLTLERASPAVDPTPESSIDGEAAAPPRRDWSPPAGDFPDPPVPDIPGVNPSTNSTALHFESLVPASDRPRSGRNGGQYCLANSRRREGVHRHGRI